MITVIFKAIEKCNSNCIYCGVIQKHQNIVMNYDLLQLILQRINDFLIENPNEKINLTWHGGEVCMLGADYFYKAMELLDKYCETTKNRIIHSVQSNLTLINQEIIDAFKILGITSVGSSYEFIPHIRGFGKTRNTTEYNKRFFEGINLLEENGLGWGIIYVVHKQSLSNPLEVFYTLTNFTKAPKINRIYMYDNDEHNLSVTGKEYANFLGTIFPIWWKHKDIFPKVRPFSEFYESCIHKENRTVCELSGKCSHNWIYIGPTGKVSQCGRAGDFEMLPYGDIQSQSFKELLQNPVRDDFKNRTAFLKNTECKDCRFWTVCHGGCPMDAIAGKKNIYHKSPHCEWVKPFLTDYFEPITGLEFSF
jgi:uncharacterized protein